MRVRCTAMAYSVGTTHGPGTAPCEPPLGNSFGPTMTSVDMIQVRGPARLEGTVTVAGAKNSALKLMAAALLAEGRTVLRNVPRITDIGIMAEVLRRLGCSVHAQPPDELA